MSRCRVRDGHVVPPYRVCVDCHLKMENEMKRCEGCGDAFVAEGDTCLECLARLDHDPVSTPAHYIEGRQYEPRKVIQDWKLCWELGNALKYIARAGRKGDEAEDLRKAIEYIKYRLEVIA